MLDHATCYAALQRRDPRYDGLFFVAVRTTKIYCRPICPARTPFSRNITFFEAAAQAREAGYRPCLRCRPESAPDSPAWIGSRATVNRALRLIDEGALVDAGVEQLAERLGMTARHLHRLFIQHLGIGPLSIEQTRRIHLAKALLHETGLPMTEIAHAAGFGSLRRFNETFQTLFKRPPTAIRRDARAKTAGGRAPLRLRLGYRPPFDWTRRLAEHGALTPHERIDGATYRRSLTIDGVAARFVLSPASGHALTLALDGVPPRALARVIAEVKREFLYATPVVATALEAA